MLRVWSKRKHIKSFQLLFRYIFGSSPEFHSALWFWSINRICGIWSTVIYLGNLGDTLAAEIRIFPPAHLTIPSCYVITFMKLIFWLIFLFSCSYDQKYDGFLSSQLEELLQLMIDVLPCCHFSAKRHRLDCLYFLTVHVSKVANLIYFSYIHNQIRLAIILIWYHDNLWIRFV